MFPIFRRQDVVARRALPAPVPVTARSAVPPSACVPIACAHAFAATPHVARLAIAPNPLVQSWQHASPLVPVARRCRNVVPRARVREFDVAPVLLAISPGSRIRPRCVSLRCAVAVDATRPGLSRRPRSLRWGPNLCPSKLVLTSETARSFRFVPLHDAALAVLADQSFAAAERKVQGLFDLHGAGLKGVFLGRLLASIQGRAPRQVGWGQSPGMDHLVLRAIRRRRSRGMASTVWDGTIDFAGSLTWLGHSLQARPPRQLPPAFLPVAIAAVAAHARYSGAVRWVSDNPQLMGGIDGRGPLLECLALLGLRAIVEESLSTKAIDLLLAGIGMPAHASTTVGWELPLVAMHDLLARGESGTWIPLAARCIAAAVRGRAQHEGIMLNLFGSASATARPYTPPPNSATLVGVLATYLGVATDGLVREIVTDTALLSAALFGMSGNEMSARVHLAECGERVRGSEVFLLVRSALSRRTPQPDRLIGWARAQVETSAMKRIVSEFLSTVDPSVEAGTPVWVVCAGPSWTTLLLSSPKRELFRAVKAAIRSDLRERNSRWWLLKGTEQREFLGLFRAVADDLPRPDRRDWRVVLDAVASETLELP